jgi:beta-xylosidase
VLPRVDIHGQPMDIHDGKIVQFEQGGLYYYYGMGYGKCHSDMNFGCAGAYLLGDCGFRTNHSINLYTSSDLSQWTFVGDILPCNSDRPLGIYYRPKVIYNRQTRLYVLWLNCVPRDGPLGKPNFRNSSYVVATSLMPAGPFTIVKRRVQTLVYANPGDFDLFVDDTGPNRSSTGYIVYDSIDTLHRIQIEQLTPDYTDSLGRAATTGPLTSINNEAPMLFKRAQHYYLLFGQCCCFCRSGSNSHVLVSRHPLGPWTDTHIDIDPIVDEIINGTMHRQSISGGQESFVIEVAQNDSSTVWIFVSDRWGSGATIADDRQYWQPLTFNDTQEPPTIKPIQWVDEFTLDLATPSTNQLDEVVNLSTTTMIE